MSENNKSLLALVDESANLERMLIESGGEMTPEIEAALAIPELHLPQKIDNYALVMERMDSIADFYKAKADMFLRLAKSANAVNAACKENLKIAMETLGQEEIKGFDIRFKLVKSNPSCVIENEEAIDAAYKITETIVKLDKKRMTEDLKLGVPVQGARLEQGYSLRQYANTPTSKKAVSK